MRGPRTGSRFDFTSLCLIFVIFVPFYCCDVAWFWLFYCCGGVAYGLGIVVLRMVRDRVAIIVWAEDRVSFCLGFILLRFCFFLAFVSLYFGCVVPQRSCLSYAYLGACLRWRVGRGQDLVSTWLHFAWFLWFLCDFIAAAVLCMVWDGLGIVVLPWLCLISPCLAYRIVLLVLWWL